MPWDPMRDYRVMKGWTEDFFSLWRSYKPVICRLHGYAVAGGSDIALCADLVVMAEDARIGYIPARVWGCPTTAMWVYQKLMINQACGAAFTRRVQWRDSGKPIPEGGGARRLPRRSRSGRRR
jgi:enoyl-CoA hydratase/carnithine racemase